MIKLYCLKLDSNLSSEFSVIMSSKYTDDKSRIMSNFAWYCLEQILFIEEKIQISSDMICYNEHGKPYLKKIDTYFNISHCENYVLIGISDSEIGVDIQLGVDIDKAQHIIRKFNDKTIAEFNISDEKEVYFSKKWVLLESYVKMLGTGLNFNLFKSLDLNDLSRVLSFKDENNMYYYVAVNKSNERVGVVNYVL